MKNQFIYIFKAVEPAEQAAFQHYIGHFYGQQKVVLNTFEQAVKSIAANDEQAFLTNVKNDKKTLNDLSDLKKWLLEFLTIQEVKNNSYDAKFLTLQALKKRGLHGVFSDKSKLLSQELNKHEKPDIWLDLLKLRLNHADYFNTENEKMADHQAHLQALLDQLDNFYSSTKLRYSAELESRKNILKEQYNPRFLTEILASIDGDDALNPIIKDLYLPLLNLIKNKSETAYFALKAFLSKNPAHDQQEKLAILLYLLNFAAYRMRHNDPIFNNEYFELTQIGLNQSLFIAAGYFPTRTFNNIVNVGSMVKGYNWTKKFIEEWSIHLSPDDKLVGHNLALARLNFGEKKFQMTIDYLQKLENHKNIHFLVEIKSLLARAYYEQKIESSRQNALCDSFELQVRRVKRVNENLRTSALNFIKILRFLINDKPKNQIISALNKKDEIVICYEWLKAKIEECKT